MLISLNGTLITPLLHQSFLMCVRSGLPSSPSVPIPWCLFFCLCHCLYPAPPSLLYSPPTTTSLSLSHSPDPSSNIPRLCNSDFAFLALPFPSALLPLLFSLWGVAVMRWKATFLSLRLFPSLSTSLSTLTAFLPFCSLCPISLPS